MPVSIRISPQLSLILIYTVCTEFLSCRSWAFPLHIPTRRPPPDKSFCAVPNLSVTFPPEPAAALPCVLDGTISFLDAYDASQLSYTLSTPGGSGSADDPPSAAAVPSGGAAGRSLAHIADHYPPGSAARHALRGHVRAVLSYAQGLRKSPPASPRDGGGGAAPIAGFGGRITLGFCAPNVGAGLAGLRGYVSGNDLPRGLLHGMDVDGAPVEKEGPVYIRYCSGGCQTFAEMRATKLGWEGLWHPGDAMVESYEGEYEGIYVNIDFGEEYGRQWGVMPLDLFSDETD
eukprot:CAMPEP_0194287234 /NCGR_PEP_ID=MMETSP0169-20130528/34299_1 /TAXON_ID=218684 /ORGANISM="Corethron pennatum, Strain L29A3" /LENGTH=287 /DNA_ID=CAMNT_0039033873 /DNA_START=21 /DNA_END=884 /DNA_ORIENTATION=-